MPKKTEKDFITNLVEFYKATGEIPTYASYKKYPGLIFPGAEFAKKFGKFSIALEKAGFEPFYNENGEINKSRLSNKEIKFCLECNREILSKTANIFCGMSCSAKFHNKDKISYDRIGECKNCNKNFSKRNINHAYCSINCRNDYTRVLSLEKFKNGELRTNKALKTNLILLNGYYCSEEMCKISDWHGKEITLEVDHIDGNPDNNKPENLRLLCPNCHSQTDTFRVKNLNGPKSDRRSRYRRKIYYNAE